MANSILVLCARSTHQLLLSLKRITTSARRLLLLLCLVLAIALFLALLFPRLQLDSLLSFFLSRYSLLDPAPIFLFSNFLILVIVLSSSPPSHSFVFSSPLASPADKDILRYSSSSELPLQPVSGNSRLVFSAPQHNEKPQLQDVSVSSQCRSEPLDEVDPICYCSWQSVILPMFSQHTVTETLPTILQTSAPTVPETEMKDLANAERASNEHQLAVKEHATEEHFVAASFSSRLNRRKSDQRPCDTAVTSTKTLRRTEAMDDASMVFRASCDGKPSMIGTELPPIESLSDEDANERFAEFIAKSLATMKKELLECTD